VTFRTLRSASRRNLPVFCLSPTSFPHHNFRYCPYHSGPGREARVLAVYVNQKSKVRRASINTDRSKPALEHLSY